MMDRKFLHHSFMLRQKYPLISYITVDNNKSLVSNVVLETILSYFLYLILVLPIKVGLYYFEPQIISITVLSFFTTIRSLYCMYILNIEWTLTFDLLVLGFALEPNR